ncbi:hypothetical protein EJB05_49136 [Eragrostis curvula]|uniref:Uncharacterized protein n=1 Tax=Eragrostis curvula TaxID=38414 RepID=A0A5J9T3G2_9POAL|nr:hypothetical protein EJB05_49135 [Eragrostis curvula]TVU05950.1 hypothetical protein EJB05_49136 [Eragrostis curvula]
MAPPRVHADSPQTAVPTRAVEPGRTRRIAVAAPPLPAAALQRRARVVLYYKSADADGGLWEEAVWAKEALSEAVADHPEMAGRLRRRAADGSWEVKLNDAGVRFVNATADAAVEEFLEDERRRARWEAALAPWADVNAEDPDMCALFYLQLTRFQGDGGYAVGVSCSLLLCDPLTLARFLLSWARTHAEMKGNNKLACTNPLMQYALYFQRPDAIAVRALAKSIPLDDTPAAGAGADDDSRAAATETTVLFRARAGGAAKGAPSDHRALAAACVGQATKRLGGAPPLQFSVVVSDGREKMSIETACTADDGQTGTSSGHGGQYEIAVAPWSELGLEELVLRDSKPVHVSYSIVTGGGDEGLAVVMPDGAAGNFLVTATVTK